MQIFVYFIIPTSTMFTIVIKLLNMRHFFYCKKVLFLEVLLILSSPLYLNPTNKNILCRYVFGEKVQL